MKNDLWHPKHSSRDFLTNPPPFQESESFSSSWCLPFYDTINRKGFIFSVRIDVLTRRMYCDAFAVDAVPTETDMLHIARSYWQECIFPSTRYIRRRSYGDRAFFIDGGLIRMLVRNVTTSLEWKDETTDGTAIFALDIAVIRDPILQKMLKSPASITAPPDSDWVFLVQLDPDYRLIFDSSNTNLKCRYREVENMKTLVTVRREDLPILLIVDGSLGQLGINVGLDDTGKAWIDLAPSISDEKKVNQEFIKRSEGRGSRLSLVSGQCLQMPRAASGGIWERTIVVETGGTTSPLCFGSHWVSLRVIENQA
jgi:hypothetical protein